MTRFVKYIQAILKFVIEKLEMVYGHVAKEKLGKLHHVVKENTLLQNGLMKKLRNISLIDHLSTLVNKNRVAEEILNFMVDFQVTTEEQ